MSVQNCRKLKSLLSQLKDFLVQFSDKVEGQINLLPSPTSGLNKLNECTNLITSYTSKIVTFTRDFHILSFSVTHPKYGLSFNFKKWEPACLNYRKFIKEELFGEKNLNKYCLIKKASPLQLGIHKFERTLTRDLVKVNKKFKNIQNAFKIEVYFKRQNGDFLEVYKGGWNTHGEMHGFGILFKLNKEGDIFQSYRGEFYRGVMHGSGIMVNFLKEGWRKIKIDVKFGEIKKGKFLNRFGQQIEGVFEYDIQDEDFERIE